MPKKTTSAPSHNSDHTPQLRQLMAAVGLSSLTALYQASGLPRRQISRLRRGQLQSLPVQSLVVLSQVLQTSIPDLLALFSPETSDVRPGLSDGTAASPQPSAPRDQQELVILKAEYHRLQNQQAQLQQDLERDCQHQVLHILESLLLQWPTAAYAAQKNPEAPAVKMLPLLRPLEQLLHTWHIEPIGEVGAELAYEPQWHQPMGGGPIEPGHRVRVRYVGYRQGEQLLYRAKVSPVP